MTAYPWRCTSHATCALPPSTPSLTAIPAPSRSPCLPCRGLFRPRRARSVPGAAALAPGNRSRPDGEAGWGPGVGQLQLLQCLGDLLMQRATSPAPPPVTPLLPRDPRDPCHTRRACLPLLEGFVEAHPGRVRLRCRAAHDASAEQREAARGGWGGGAAEWGEGLAREAGGGGGCRGGEGSRRAHHFLSTAARNLCDRPALPTHPTQLGGSRRTCNTCLTDALLPLLPLLLPARCLRRCCSLRF